ncbi:MAG: hypothetical protein K0S19_1360 [Geminicoccaceae bacterium]|nr:hypothetical protein [Geminicoccaceae bacterium]
MINGFHGTSMLMRPSNEMRISCKRPEKTYVPYRLWEGLPITGVRARPRLSAAFAG